MKFAQRCRGAWIALLYVDVCGFVLGAYISRTDLLCLSDGSYFFFGSFRSIQLFSLFVVLDDAIFKNGGTQAGSLINDCCAVLKGRREFVIKGLLDADRNSAGVVPRFEKSDW